MTSTLFKRKTRSQDGILLKGLKTHRKSRVKRIVVENIQSKTSNMTGNLPPGNPPTNEELAAEVARLRQLNNVQNAQLAELRARLQTESQDSKSRLVKTLIEGLKGLKVDIKLPRFEDSENPNQFIQRLEKYIAAKQLSESDVLHALNGALGGRAQTWFDTHKDSFRKYNNFKIKFLADFYSIPIRVKIKSN